MIVIDLELLLAPGGRVSDVELQNSQRTAEIKLRAIHIEDEIDDDREREREREREIPSSSVGDRGGSEEVPLSYSPQEDTLLASSRVLR